MENFIYFKTLIFGVFIIFYVHVHVFMFMDMLSVHAQCCQDVIDMRLPGIFFHHQTCSFIVIVISCKALIMALAAVAFGLCAGALLHQPVLMSMSPRVASTPKLCASGKTPVSRPLSVKTPNVNEAVDKLKGKAEHVREAAAKAAAKTAPKKAAAKKKTANGKAVDENES